MPGIPIMKNLIIVTGGAGFVGSNLIELLLKKTKYQIISLDNYSSGSKKNSKFPIHDDTPNKLLSGVVYLSPENNSGTSFYTNQNGDNKTSIKWVCNNAVFFSRKEKETWHSYEGNGIDNRIVLVYNLMTTNIRKVFKIEKKNYLLGSFRYRFNPYFYKYLKITI